ncbi:MAG: hypothetical protein LQ348_002530 [Seirophora lacunosa]|nr:MAG: hypothetical protein LQ348_002530 [Seirophora lacunosa]
MSTPLTPSARQANNITRNVRAVENEPTVRRDSLPDGNGQENLGYGDIEGRREKTIPESIHPAPVLIPKSQRRGILGRFTAVAEVEEPKDYSRRTKWYITFVVAMAAMAAPLGSAIILPALGQISAEFHAEPAVTNIAVALYMLAMAVGPLWWSSFSETSGRRTIYLVSFLLFVIWNILGAVSTNIAMLIVMRLLGGGAAASVQAVGAGTIADIWEVKERGNAMSIFYLGPLCGPLLAPIIGGVLAQRWGWRSTQWFQALYGGVILIFLVFALPETLKVANPPVDDTDKEAASLRPGLARISSRQKVQQASRKWTKMLKRWFIDPLRIIFYLRFPAVSITVYYASITFAILYMLNISLQDTFSKPPYSFSTIQVGLVYIPNSLGYLLTSLFGGKWTDRIMAREAKKAGRYDEHGKLVYRPEDRMRENAWIAAFLYPAALIWYGWAAEKGVHWVVPLVANFWFGVGSMLVFAMATTMLTEFMPEKASAGVAVNNFARNICSCIGAVTADPLISAIGNGWLFTGLGVIAMASSVVIWAMRKYGPRWRQVMDRERD